MLHTQFLPFNYITLSKDGALRGHSRYLQIQIDTDQLADITVLEFILKNRIQKYWNTLWIEEGFEGVDPLFHHNMLKVTTPEFLLEIPFEVQVHNTFNLEQTIKAELYKDLELECRVTLVDTNPSEMKLMGIDFITLFEGGCCVVEPLGSIPENFLDLIQSLRGYWLMHQGLEIEHDKHTWLFKNKENGIRVFIAKEKVLLGRTPYEALAQEVLRRTGLKQVKLRFLGGYELVFGSNPI